MIGRSKKTLKGKGSFLLDLYIGLHIPLPPSCPLTLPLPPPVSSSYLLSLPASPPASLFSFSLARLLSPLLTVCVAVFVFFPPWPLCLEGLTDRLPSSSLPPPLLLPLPLSLPPRLTWPTTALMVVSRVGPRGLVEVEDSLGQSGPAWTAVWAAYTTVFIPLSSSLYSSKALHFFLWVSRTKGTVKKGEIVVKDKI